MPAFKLKVILRGSDPKITRTIAVPTDLTFADLHGILQVVMPWTDYHMHEFYFPKHHLRIVQDRRDSFFSRDREELEDEMMLADFHGDRFQYIYDFGDDWIHDITWLKDIQDRDEDYPKVLKYTEEAPPEDCGGIWGYYNLLTILDDPDHPEHESMMEWYGDPEPYDIDEVNAYFETFWARSEPRERVPADAMADVAHVLSTATQVEYAYDRRLQEVVCIGNGDGEFEVADPEAPQEEGRLVPIRPKVNSELFARCTEFCKDMDREGREGFSGLICESKRDFDEISRKVEKAGLLERWEMFLDQTGSILASYWAEDNNLVEDHPGSDATSPDIISQVLSAMMTDVKIHGRMFMCPVCGTMLKGELDFAIPGLTVKGRPVYSAAIECHNCGRRTLLAEMNDGFSVRFHYLDDRIPCEEGERIIRARLDARGLEGPERAMRLADAAQEYLVYRRVEGLKTLDEAMGCFDGVPDDPEGFEAYQRVLALRLLYSDLGPYSEKAKTVEDRLHGDFGSLALATLGMNEEDPAERARLLGLSESRSDGSDLWAGLLAAIIRADRWKEYDEPDCEALAELRSLFDRCVEAVPAEDRGPRLKFLMLDTFEDMEDMAYVLGAEIPGRDPAEVLLEAYPEDRIGVNTVRCVALFRRGLNRLRSEEPGGLEDIQELIRVVRDNRDFGPYCMVRCAFACILAYWYGSRDRKLLEDATNYFTAIIRDGRADDVVVNDFVTALVLAGSPDLGMDEVIGILKGGGLGVDLRNQDDLPEFKADIILSMCGPFGS